MSLVIKSGLVPVSCLSVDRKVSLEELDLNRVSQTYKDLHCYALSVSPTEFRDETIWQSRQAQEFKSFPENVAENPDLLVELALAYNLELSSQLVFPRPVDSELYLGRLPEYLNALLYSGASPFMAYKALEALQIIYPDSDLSDASDVRYYRGKFEGRSYESRRVRTLISFMQVFGDRVRGLHGYYMQTGQMSSPAELANVVKLEDLEKVSGIGAMDEDLLGRLHRELVCIEKPERRDTTVQSNWGPPPKDASLRELLRFFKHIGDLTVLEADPALIPALQRLADLFREDVYNRCVVGMSGEDYKGILDSWREAVSELEKIEQMYVGQGAVPEHEREGFLRSRALVQLSQIRLKGKPAGKVSIKQLKQVLGIRPSFMGDSMTAMSARGFVELCEFFPSDVVIAGRCYKLNAGSRQFLDMDSAKKIESITFQVMPDVYVSSYRIDRSSCMFTVEWIPGGMERSMEQQVRSVVEKQSAERLQARVDLASGTQLKLF